MTKPDTDQAEGNAPGAGNESPEFWLTCGYRLLDHGDDGHLHVTSDFLRAFFRRPEVEPIEESCPAERALHRALLDNPRLPVDEAKLQELADPDARENYRIVLGFRDLLVAQDTLEAAYLSLFRTGVNVPPLFIDQLAHAILCGLLQREGDPLRLRAAELMFRSQKVSIQDSGIMLADEEVVEMYGRDGGFGSLGKLLADNATPMRSVELDILSPENAAIYWERSDRFDTVIDLSFARPALDALCRVLESWVVHFLGVQVRIYPVQEISDPKWSWHLGLDPHSTAILNDLYNGQEVGQERLARLLSLFRLEFADPADMLPEIAGKPVYLGLAMSEAGLLKMKPQNLLINLPLAGEM